MKKLITLFFTLLFFAGPGCFDDSGDKKKSPSAVTIVKGDGYYSVTIDYRLGLSRREIGSQYMAAIIETCPDYQSLTDSYLQDMNNFSSISSKIASYSTMLGRVAQIKPQIRSEFLDEIGGMADRLETKTDLVGDNKLSPNELFALLLFPDLGRGWACSGFSVYGTKTADGNTVTGRNLDFLPGTKMQMAKTHAVITLKYENRAVCMIGFLGNIAAITAFNDEGVFAAILDSPANEPAIDCSGKNSYTLDLRYAIENFSTAADVAGYMTDSARDYTWNHNLLLADKTTSVVAENNVTGTRTIRNAQSELNTGITWGHTDAIAVVNSFIAKGTADNHTNNATNTGRWNSFLSLMDAAPDKIGVGEVKNIIGNHSGSATNSHIYRGPEYAAANGNISMNLHTVIFTPAAMALEVHFTPATGPLADPLYRTINVDFN